MSRQSERDLFIANLCKALPDQPTHIVTHAARLLLRHAKSHGRIAEAECNGHPVHSSAAWLQRLTNEQVNKMQEEHEAWCEKRRAQLERRMSAIAGELGLTIEFGGDPRGYTVKLHLPTGVYNTWGGRESGYGVPQ